MLRGALAASFALAAIVLASFLGSTRSEAGAAPAALGAHATQLSHLLGFVDESLVRVNPETLRPLPGAGIPVGSGGCASRQGGTACWSVAPWTVSPDATQLVVARNDASVLRVVDVSRMRVAADIGLDGEDVGAVAWLTGRRVLALQEVGSERQRLITVDLVKRRVIARRALGGSVVQLARTPHELVILLAPSETIAPARLAVVSRRGAVRFVRLRRILAGSKLLGNRSDHRLDARLPGLAVDQRRGRIFVVGESLAAEVDLQSLSVFYRTPVRPTSLFGRLRNWLEPAAEAKQVSGYARVARWLGGNVLAVSGVDSEQGRTVPAGLRLVDTRRWTVRTVDRGATDFRFSGGVLLVTGGTSVPVTGTPAIGLAAYGLDGEKQYELLQGETAWIAHVQDGRAFVGIVGQEPLRIVEIKTGRVVGERRAPLPSLVRGVAASWWEP
jgi:hypothetical protein